MYRPQHLVVDGLVCRDVNLDRVGYYIDTLIDLIGMHELGVPQLYAIPEGWIGMQVIAESHVSVHIKPDYQYYGDVFSCMEFDSEVVVAFMVDYWRLDKVEYHTINRSQLVVR